MKISKMCSTVLKKVEGRRCRVTEEDRKLISSKGETKARIRERKDTFFSSMNALFLFFFSLSLSLSLLSPLPCRSNFARGLFTQSFQCFSCGEQRKTRYNLARRGNAFVGFNISPVIVRSGCFVTLATSRHGGLCVFICSFIMGMMKLRVSA